MRSRTSRKSRVSKVHSGFTIIEVLIVLAIAGLILLIVFLAIPALNRSTRNHTRKLAVDYTAAELNEYFSMHNSYPLSGTSPSQDGRTSFVNDLKTSGATSLMTINYSDEEGSHEYPFNLGKPSSALDQISIEPGHKCNRTPGLEAGDTDYPLQTARGGDADFRSFVVWTPIETAKKSTLLIYCIDNAYQ